MNQFEKRPRGEPIRAPVETKLCIIVDSKTPIIMKVPLAPENITLKQFKSIASLQDQSYKFYFRSKDDEFGIVKEELTEDDAVLPVEGDRIVAWIISDQLDSSALFDHESNYGQSINNSPKLNKSYTYNHTSSPLSSNSFSHPGGSSSVYESTEPAVSYIYVQLLLDNYNFLGLTIVGPCDEFESKDKGIYVGKITKDSVIERDGRIKVGDKILGINEYNLQSLKNDEAVATFKHCVEKRGAITLLLERGSNSNFLDQIGHYSPPPPPTLPPNNYLPTQTCLDQLPMPNHHANNPMAARPLPVINRTSRSLPRSVTPRSIYQATGSENVVSYHESPSSLNSRSMYGTTTLSSGRNLEVALHCRRHDIHTIFAALRNSPNGLEVKDREWLKVVIKDAFLGSDLIKWLRRNVYGFSSRREIKSYANQMLSLGLIKNPMTNGAFSERIFYTFC